MSNEETPASNGEVDSLNDLTDDELMEVLDEEFYTLTTTGMEAVANLVWEIGNHTFSRYHNLSDERMMVLLLRFARSMMVAWDTPAMEWYQKEGVR